MGKAFFRIIILSGFIVYRSWNQFSIVLLVLLSLCQTAFSDHPAIKSPKSQSPDSGLPHIVVYLSDDHSQFDSQVYGADDIPTPNLEKLAASGMLFTHAFVASPSCAPSRAAMLTGLMPARNGAEANHTYPRAGTHYLIDNLKAAGYEVVAFGKVGHGKNQSRAPFDRSELDSNYPKLKNNLTTFLQDRESDKPLCLFAGISNPHVPWPKESSFDPAAVRFPPTHLDTPSTRVHRAAYYEEIKMLDQLAGDIRLLADEHLGNNVLYIHTSDHGSQWPFGKWTLYDYGIRVPLIVSWPGKIEPGSQTSAMVSWLDLIPTILELSGGAIPESIDGQSFADVLTGKTTTHRDQIFTTTSGDGRMNVYPIRSVRTQDWKLIHNLHPEFAFTNHSDLHRKPLAGAYWAEWADLAKTDARATKIVDRYYRRPEWELYHVAEDKWEETNLIDDPAHDGLIAELKSALANWMAAQADKETVFQEPRLLSNKKDWHPDYDNRAKPKRQRK